MAKFLKLEILYPDGTIDCEDIVAKTYKNAVNYIGLKKNA